MIYKLLDWLKGKAKECSHPRAFRTAQPYDGDASFKCPDPPDGCGKEWTEYDAESDEDPEMRL